MKNLIILLLIILHLFYIVSCKNEDASSEVEMKTTDYQGMTIIEKTGMTNVFSSKSIELEFKYMFTLKNNFDKYFILNDRIYITNKKLDTQPELYLLSYDLNNYEDSVDEIIIEPLNINGVVKFMWYDSNYNQIIIEESDYEYTLYKKTMTGEIEYSIPLNISDTVISMALGIDDNTFIGCNDYVLIYENDGAFIDKILLDYNLSHIVSAHDKTPILKMYESNTYSVKYKYINSDKLILEDVEMPIPYTNNYTYNNILFGIGYDYYYCDSNGIYGYNITDNNLIKVLDWINSDIVYTDVALCAIMSNDKMVVIIDEIYNKKLSVLNHISDDEVPFKEYISIAYISEYNDQYLYSLVSSFNKNNEKYRITLTNYYSQTYGTNYTLKLNNEIAAGNVPDLLYINGYFSLLNYVNKNMFVDLYDYLNEENELNNNLLSFVTEQAEINGKLNQMITSFTLQTLMSKVKNHGNKANFSIYDIESLNNTLNADCYITQPSYYTRSHIGSFVVVSIMSECIDYANASCDFNKSEVKNAIEILKLLPENINSNLTQIDIYEKTRNDEILYSIVSIDSLMKYVINKALYFRDEEVIFTGYPTISDYIREDYVATNGFSIFNSSNNKNGAWEFIKYALSDEFNYNIPQFDTIMPTISSIKMNIDKYDTNGYVYITDTYQSIQGSDAKETVYDDYGSGILVNIDDDLILEFTTFLQSINNYKDHDYDVINIINEELSIYYNSDKSADDTINAIQSRVSIYMSEMWG